MASQPITTASSSQPQNPNPPSSSTESPMSDPDNRDAPPHLDPTDPPVPPAPPVDPALQAAMAAFFASMTQQMNANQRAAPPQQHIHHAPRSRVKTRDLDPYDGSDPSKLRAFLAQCRLVFRARPEEYRDDTLKIMYAVSWLSGTAQRWYEPNLALDEDDLPDYALTWAAFEEALKGTFGEPDPVASATQKLDNLVMKDHHHLNKYNVDFNEYSTLTGFDERALYAKYYKGLAPRIKDSLAITGRPNTLARLRDRAQGLDLRYWERKDEEKSHPSAAKASTSTSTSRSSGTSSATFSSPSKSASTSTQSKPASRHSTPSGSTPKPKNQDIAKFLGPDGKLLPEEKERRKQNDLCIICGGSGHFSDKCPHRKENVKGRGASLEDGESQSEAESSEDLN